MAKDQQITRNLANAEIAHAERNRRANAPAFNAPKTLYRIYTQYLPGRVDVEGIIARYFAGATLYFGVGLDARTQHQSENSLTIDIVSSLPDSLQRVLDLAGDLRVAGEQVSVLVTQQDVRTFEVTADVPRVAEPGRHTLDRVSDSPTINPASKAQAHRFAGLA